MRTIRWFTAIVCLFFILPGVSPAAVSLGTNVIYQSHGGSNSHVIEATANYQYNFSPHETAAPYLTLGGGMLNVGGSSGSGATSGLFGGGLGISARVAAGHGSIRMEMRYDRLGDSDRISRAGMFGIRLGFDLWMK